ncbi:hypothetical protein ACIQD3_23545 [Peribacillus loiseleuriae]|uniref:hypothetical protein n=1 Tax=Peribacillus loiseleuriae TaxID=1679170 RepID=UPI00382283BB
MLKRQQVKSMRKELDKITKNKTSGIFVVFLNDDQYTVKASNGDTFQGTAEEFEIFSKSHDEYVFVIMNIPRPIVRSDE